MIIRGNTGEICKRRTEQSNTTRWSQVGLINYEYRSRGGSMSVRSGVQMMFSRLRVTGGGWLVVQFAK